MLKNIQSSPLLTQQGAVQDVINKTQNIISTFSKMPLNSGKLEFIKAALPLLTQVQSLSSDLLGMVQKGQSIDTAQTTKIGGLLDQVKGLLGQAWSVNPLTTAQTPEANNQVQQLSGILTNILKNQGDVLKKMTQAATVQ
jgi:phage-related protein